MAFWWIALNLFALINVYRLSEGQDNEEGLLFWEWGESCGFSWPRVGMCRSAKWLAPKNCIFRNTQVRTSTSNSEFRARLVQKPRRYDMTLALVKFNTLYKIYISMSNPFAEWNAHVSVDWAWVAAQHKIINFLKLLLRLDFDIVPSRCKRDQ